MINGEGTREESVSALASPDPFDSGDSKSDGSPSRYSSCGESEFDRYCSANSVMGTPSLCSSVYNDCLDSEFGSFRSSTFGDDSSGLENFNLGGRSGRSSEERNLSISRIFGDSRSEFLLAKLDNVDMPSNHGCEDPLNSALGTHGLSSFGGRAGDASDQVVLPPPIDSLSQSVSVYGRLDHGKDMITEEEETDLEYEHSEDDGSMYNYGSDDESGKNFPYVKNIESNHVNKDRESPFTINSSVAFGAKDWDDFAQETGENNGHPLIWDKFLEPTVMNPEAQRKHLTVPPVRENPVKMIEEQVKETDAAMKTRGNESVTPVGYLESTEFENAKMHDVTGRSSTSFQGSSQKDIRDIAAISIQGSVDKSREYLNKCCSTNISEMGGAPMVETTQLELKPCTPELRKEGYKTTVDSREHDSSTSDPFMEDRGLESCDPNLDHPCQACLNQTAHRPKTPLVINTQLSGDDVPNSPKYTMLAKVKRDFKNFPFQEDLEKDNISLTKTEVVELNDFVDDVLHDMEEILLDSAESPGVRFSQGKRPSLSEWPLRDGGLTASPSDFDELDTFIRQNMKIDGVEVIGAKQKKGDVSLSERLVGVKEHTVYVIRVWSGTDRWDVERRYRDFLTLYRRLKAFFAEQGLSLPIEWSFIEKELGKIFGSLSPDVVARRSALIQDSLQSILHSKFSSKLPNAFLWFLSPQDLAPSTPKPNELVRQPTFVAEGTDFAEKFSTLGKTIPLIVEIRPYRSMKQILEVQHYCCAGCRKHFDDDRTLMQEFVQTFGWGNPRLCEYMGQLFCSSCHTNEMAILPARVLHNWDFTEYPVCQLAKSYLDSIYDKPMLCVSAVNPFLFAKVPGLFHVMGVRKKIGAMLPYVRCPFRLSVNKALGSRRYLIESNDFFALRDLIDLSKGAFAALPTMLETVTRRVREHIAELCLICCDVGVPCGAKQACKDSSFLIFPFQEDEIKRCRSCNAVFHKECFEKLKKKCYCKGQVIPKEVVESKMEGTVGSLRNQGNGVTDLLGRKSSSFSSSVFSGNGLFSGLFSTMKSDHPKEEGAKEKAENVILMGSLPSTSF